jgi:hypothetical protein
LAYIATAFWIRITDFIITAFEGDVVPDGVSKVSRVLTSTVKRAVFETVAPGDAEFSMDKDEIVGWVR